MLFIDRFKDLLIAFLDFIKYSRIFVLLYFR